MAAPALTASTSLTVFAVGAAANLVANNKPLEAKTWAPGGRFIGLINGRGAKSAATSAPPTPSAPPASAPSGAVPIGGATNEPAPPVPFGRFRKCKPTKLPGPPKPYDPANSP